MIALVMMSWFFNLGPMGITVLSATKGIVFAHFALLVFAHLELLDLVRLQPLLSWMTYASTT